MSTRVVAHRPPNSSSNIKPELAATENLRIQQAFDRAPAYYASLLKSCGDSRDLAGAKRVHSLVLGSAHSQNRYLLNLMVEMYGKCESLGDARRVFESISCPNLFSWNIMINAYVQNGCYSEALELYKQMSLDGFKPDMFTFPALFNACASLRALEEGKALHAHAVASSFVSHIVVGTALINMYGKCGSLEQARSIFDNMPERSVVSWTIMFAAYAETGDLQEARNLFERMPTRDVVSWTALLVMYAESGNLKEAESTFERMPQRNVVSWNAMISAYALNGDLQEAKRIFDRMPERDVASWTALFGTYAESGDVEEARKIFDEMPQRNVVGWNAMIAVYAQNGYLEEARNLFDRNPEESVVSQTTMIVAYARSGHLQEAREVFDKIQERDVVSWNAMIAAYAQNGHLVEATSMFENMPQKNVASWNAMVGAYALNGQGKKAIHLFRMLDLEGVHTDRITLISALDACANLGALAEGKAIHAHIAGTDFLLDVIVGNALVNMYSKCGHLHEARGLFDAMLQQDRVSWNGMIAAYAQNGHGEEAVELFRAMNLEGVQPSDITFINILSACSHAGSLEDGRNYFVSLSPDYEILPVLDHYVCIIDLLGRLGRLKEAEELIHSMPLEPHEVTWMTLLASCKVHSDVERGARAADHAIGLDPKNASPYMLLSNIHAAEQGNQTLSSRLRISSRTWAGRSSI